MAATIHPHLHLSAHVDHCSEQPLSLLLLALLWQLQLSQHPQPVQQRA
jgi:hypothetical protein